MQVKVLVNGHSIPFDMKIGDAGEAFFVFETDGDVPDELITSPLLQPTDVGQTEGSELSTGRFGAADGEPEVEGLRAGSDKPDLSTAEYVSLSSKNHFTRQLTTARCSAKNLSFWISMLPG